MSYTEYMRLQTERDFLTKAKEYEGMSEQFTGDVEAKLKYFVDYRDGLKKFIDNTKLNTYIGETENGRVVPKNKHKVFLFSSNKYNLMVKEIQLMDKEIERLTTLKNK